MPTEQRAPPPSSGRSVATTLLDYLTSITTWQRTFIAIVLGSFSLLGLMVYQHPQKVFELFDGAIRARGRRTERVYMTPLYSDVQRSVDRLLHTFGPNMIGVIAWRVDLDTNRQKVAAYATADEFHDTAATVSKERWQVELPLFGSNAVVNHLLGQIIAGRFACAPAADAWPALRRFPLAEVCLIGVPPDEGEPLTGFIGGGWRDPIREDDRHRIEAAFRSASSELVWRTYPTKR